MNLSYKKTAYRVSFITMIGNIILSIFKFIAGIFGHSYAMISDALHSLSDVISTIIIMIGIHFSTMSADQEHPYGHERMECIAAMILSVLLIFTGLQIAYQSLLSLFVTHTVQKPSNIALIAAVVSIMTKELMYHYTKHYAKRLNSPALFADAWHHRSDAFSSIGSLIGIGFSILGYIFMDGIAGLIISLLIMKPGFSIFYDASIKMIDHSCSHEINDELITFISKQPSVLNIDVLKTRMFAQKYYIDLEISVDENLSLNDAHTISHQVHDSLEMHFPDIKHCMIHINPKKRD